MPARLDANPQRTLRRPFETGSAAVHAKSVGAYLADLVVLR